MTGARRAVRRDAGVAFILVLTVLLGLLVLAAPFLAVALNDDAMSANVIAESQVDAGASALLRYGAWWLERTTDAGEARRGGDPLTDVRSAPDVDTEDEFQVPIDLVNEKGGVLVDADGTPLMHRQSSRGDTWDMTVRDEQSLPNLWSAPPFLIAASLGRTVHVDELKPEDTTLELEDGKDFPLTNGAVWVSGERITYARREGNTLLECTRGTPGGGRARASKAETYVFDDRAREIAMLPFKSPRAKGGWREPYDPSAAKEITLFGEGVLSPVEIDRLAREYTVASWRVSGTAFGPPQTLIAPIDPANADLTDGFKISLRRNDGINAGTIVRISDGTNTEYGFVVASERRGNSARVTLAEPTVNAYAERRTGVAPVVRHPVNVNTASRETIERILTGLQVTGGQRNPDKTGRVTVAAARLVAEALVAARPIRDLAEFRDVLLAISEAPGAALLFDQMQMIAVFRNAVDPGDWMLGTSTVGFCFKSHDHFTLLASARTSDPAGSERARRQIRERVRVAATGRQTYRLDSQRDFEAAIVRARGAIYTTTHPNPVERVNPMADNEIPASRIPRMLLNLDDEAAKHAGFPHETEGDVRLWPARMEGWNGYAEHFDGQAFGIPDNIEVTQIDPEGWILDQGSYKLPLGDSGQRSGGGRRAGGRGGGGRRMRGQGSILGRSGANPIKFDMWFRPDSGGSGHTFYDLAGSDPDQRIKLSLEASGEVHAYVRDRTIEKPGSEIEEACVTVFRPPAGLWGARNWYHVGISYKGCKPEEVAVWWDGMKRGEARFQTLLAGSMSDDDTSFSVENADDWPRRGVCWVGREVIEFERTGTSFSVIQYPNGGGTGRGRRGTYPIPHAAGEVVQLFGYSNAVESQTGRGGLAIPRGGAFLQSDLGPWCWAQYAGNDQVTVSSGGPPGAPPLIWEVLDPSKPLGDQLRLVAGPPTGEDYVDSFQASGGYIIVVGLVPQTGPTPTPVLRVELAYYGSYDRGTRTLMNVQGVSNPPNPDIGSGALQIQTTRDIMYLRMISPQPSPYYCAVFPISVGVTDVTGLLTPKTPQGASQVQPEYVSLGEPDYDDISQHKIEWIRYDHVDTSKKHLLCDSVNRVEASIAQVGLAIFGTGTGQPGSSGPRQIAESGNYLSMRGQHGTGIFDYGNLANRKLHAPSEDVTPVFRVCQYPGIGFIPQTQPNQPANPVPGHPAPGWGDSVTLETANATMRKRFDVTWSHDGHVSIGTPPGADFSQRGISPGADENRHNYLRLLKFPSGELPHIQRPAKGRAGGDVDGSVSAGRLDEIRVIPISPDRYVVWDHSAMGLSGSSGASAPTGPVAGVNETANEIPVANVTWYLKSPGGYAQLAQMKQVVLPDGRGVEYDAPHRGLPNNDAGLVQIDDEVIAFRRIGTTGSGAPALLDCERGVFNTTPTRHGFGANVTFLDFIPVTMLSNVLNATGSVVDVAAVNGFPTVGGLVLVNQELIHYTEITGQSFQMPPILDEAGEEAGGLLRGRFGTSAARHDTESIVIEMPFRYWDRYGESQETPEVAFYEMALNRPGAYFERFGYEEFRPNPNVQILALVRTEPDVPWCTDPLRTPPGLLRFDQGLSGEKGLHAIGRHGSAFEVRFYVRYLGNSFDPVTLATHDWKTTPELRWAQLDYFDETRVLTRETTE